MSLPFFISLVGDPEVSARPHRMLVICAGWRAVVEALCVIGNAYWLAAQSNCGDLLIVAQSWLVLDVAVAVLVLLRAFFSWVRPAEWMRCCRRCIAGSAA